MYRNFIVNQPFQERLQKRLLLGERPTISNPMLMVNAIQPTTNVDDLAKTPTIVVPAQVSITSTGYKTIYTIPKGKRYHVRTVYVIVADGTWTFDRLYINNATSSSIPHEILGAGVTTKVWLLNPSYRLDEDWSLSVYVDSKAVNGNLASTILAEVEDAY